MLLPTHAHGQHVVAPGTAQVLLSAVLPVSKLHMARLSIDTGVVITATVLSPKERRRVSGKENKRKGKYHDYSSKEA